MNKFVMLVNPIVSPRLKILFLGYSRDQTTLIDELISNRCEIWYTKDKIEGIKDYDLVISFGYRHIIKRDVIMNSLTPIINLHTSYLPWNRGAHPNFWSFYDCTPSGVTIHIIDEDIDTGPIIYQRYVNFNKDENTFSKTYIRLKFEIEELFKQNLDEIISKKFNSTPQRRKGTHHYFGDLPKDFLGWDSNIYDEVTRLDKILNK